MKTTGSKHLLCSLGVLSSFSIAKKINKTEIDKITEGIKKIYKGKNEKKFQELFNDALTEYVKNYIVSDLPPGIIITKEDIKKNALDEFYLKLAVISQTLIDSIQKERMTKHEVCFLINAVINILEITESDFTEFYRQFGKYKNDDFTEDE